MPKMKFFNSLEKEAFTSSSRVRRRIRKIVGSMGVTPPKDPGIELGSNWEVKNPLKILLAVDLCKILWNFRAVCLIAPLQVVILSNVLKLQ